MEKEIFQRTYDHFKKDGEWPLSLPFAVEFHEKGNLFKIGYGLDYHLIRAGHVTNKNDLIKLPIMGVALCDNSEEDVNNFVKFLQLAIRKFKEDPVECQITTADIKRELSISDLEIKRLSKILIETAGLWDSASREEKNNQNIFSFNFNILAYGEINSIEDYIQMKLSELPARFGGDRKEDDDSNLLPEPNLQVEERQLIRRNIITNNVFILMPMADKYEFNEVNKKIKEICKKYKLNAIRVDDYQTSGNVTIEILNSIIEAEFVIADLSNERPNVYYELGFAHGIGFDSASLILIAKEGTELHFDIRNLRVILYKDPKDLQTKLNKRLKALMEIRYVPEQ